jgi:hypothetical protein
MMTVYAKLNPPRIKSSPPGSSDVNSLSWSDRDHALKALHF